MKPYARPGCPFVSIPLKTTALVREREKTAVVNSHEYSTMMNAI